jgi:hypothetical protein
VNVGEDTALGNGDVTQELVQLLIVTDGELEVTRNDTGLLVVTGGVAGQLENLSSKVLEDGGQVDGSAGTDTLGIVALAEETVNTANGERETSLGRTGLRVLGARGLATRLATAGHFEGIWLGLGVGKDVVRGVGREERDLVSWEKLKMMEDRCKS